MGRPLAQGHSGPGPCDTNADLTKSRSFLHVQVQVEKSVLTEALPESQGPRLQGLREEGLGVWTAGSEGGGNGSLDCWV